MDTEFRKLMKSKGLTIGKLAEASGLSYRVIAKLASGESSLAERTYSIVYQIAKAMGISVKELTEIIPSIELDGFREGWNKLAPGLDVFVENDKVISGRLEGETVYPCVKTSTGDVQNKCDISVPLSIKEFLRLWRRGKVTWR